MIGTKMEGAYLGKEEGGGLHSDQHVEQVTNQLGLGVQGKRQDGRRGLDCADNPHLTLPEAVQLIEGLPASLGYIRQLPVPWRTG